MEISTPSISALEQSLILRNALAQKYQEQALEANAQRVKEERKQVEGNIGRNIDVFV